MIDTGPEPVSHATVQHVNGPNFINDPKPSKPPVPQLADDLYEDKAPQILTMILYLPLVTLNKIIWQNYTTHNQYYWCGCLQAAD